MVDINRLIIDAGGKVDSIGSIINSGRSFNKGGLTMNVHLGDNHENEIVMEITPLVSEIYFKDTENTFVLLEQYLIYKGENFTTEYINRVISAYNEVNSMNSSTSLPTIKVHDILDMFDVEEVYTFLTQTLRFPSLKSLVVEYDENYTRNHMGTRVQTFTQTDYLYLVALGVILKSIIGILGAYDVNNKRFLGNELNVYYIFNMIASHDIYNTYIMQKLFGMVEMVMKKKASAPGITESRVIKATMPRDELPMLILSEVVLQRLIPSSFLMDNDAVNAIKNIHRGIEAELKPDGRVDKKARNKIETGDGGGGGSDTDSRLEGWRMHTALPLGAEEEFNVAMEKLDIHLYPYGDTKSVVINRRLYNVFLSSANSIDKIHDGHIILLRMVIKKYIDPRVYSYLSLQNMRIGIAYCATVLWTLGFKSVAAMLVTSVIPINENDDNHFVLSSTRGRLNNQLKERMCEVFPYKEDMGSVCIENIIKVFTTGRYMYLLPDEYIQDLQQGDYNTVRVLTLPQDIRNILAEMIIKIEEI